MAIQHQGTNNFKNRFGQSFFYRLFLKKEKQIDLVFCRKMNDFRDKVSALGVE